MTRTKANLFDAETTAMADFARAMSHPARIAILRRLMELGPQTAGQLVEALPLAQATVSQHLKALREAELVTATEEGPRVTYRLQGARIRHFCHAFQQALGTAGVPTEAMLACHV
ncbi:MAG: metalloregulator ArsR/SmtB family transcription factor [Verrucomicrobiota bacterium JB022]|nr:metalloregulator ArsR/SmtB family transcription factor [Verrucomicrobiota bacterium JB022]